MMRIPHEMKPGVNRLRRVVVFIIVAAIGIGGVIAYCATHLRAAPPTPEPPKQDAPKQDAPKQDAPKQDAPKQDAPKAEIPAPQPKDQPNSQSLELPSLETTSLEDRCDLAIRAGHFTKGLQLVRELRTLHPDDLKTIYREALCHEGLGKWAEALKHYEVLYTQAARVRTAAPRLGAARCHMMLGRRRAAEHAIRWVSEHANTTAMQHECLYHLAQLAMQNCEVAPKLQPLDARILAWPDFTLAVDTMLDRLPLEFVTADSVADLVSNEPPPSELPKPAWLNRTDALAAVRVAWDSDPSHPAALRALLLLANSHSDAGDHARAIAEYQAIRAEKVHGELHTVATHNLGLLQWRLGKMAEARELFLELADGLLGTKWAAVGWWWLGRLELDLAHLDEAERAWKRINVPADRSVRSAAELGFVLLDYLRDREESAIERLTQARLASDDTHQHLAEAMRTNWHYTNQPTPTRAAALGRALRNADHGRAFGPAGAWLFGRWHAASGHGELQLALYEELLPTIRGPWAYRLTLAVADQLRSGGHRTEARQRYLALETADDTAIRTAARLALAQFDLADGQYPTALARCRALLAKSTANRQDVLRLMGQCYERIGQPEMAALCFAGQLPAR